MALTYGFYNSIEGDRVYDAIQFGRIFDGIIKDGVYATYEKGMMVIASSNPAEVIIQPGRAWFNHTWSYNDANVIFEAPAPEVLLERIDALVLEINEELSARENSFKWVTGTPSSRPEKPTLTNTSTIHQYPLCYVHRYPETTMIYTRDITNAIGTSECPFATGVLEGIDLDAWINQWDDEFHTWENSKKTQFEAWMLSQETAFTTWYNAFKNQMASDVQEVEDFVDYLESVLDASTAIHLQEEIDELKDEISSGSYITVTTINSELYGRNVTITEAGGTVFTEKFDNTGVAEFKSVPYVGNLTISSTYGTQTAERVVNTPYYARYEFAIAFWAATVNIVGDPEMAGSSVTVKDSEEAIVGTVVLDSEGAGVYTAIKPDTYKFTLTYGGETMEVTLSVTQETTYTVELHAASDFDYEDWLEAGGVTGSYADLDAVLADEVALRRLFLVHASVDYLAGINDENADVEKIINNDLCAKWINLSDYALDILYANEIIAGYMDTADKYGYGEWCLMPQVPTMTSDTAPSGVASASTVLSGYAAYYAFDKTDTHWNSAMVSPIGQYIAYQFPNAVCVRKMTIKNHLGFGPKKFKIQGSNDGSVFTDIASDLTTLDNENVQTILIPNDTEYLYYRLYCTEGYSSSGKELAIRELQFYAWGPKGNVPIMTANNAPYGEAISSGNFSSSFPNYYAFDNNINNAWLSNSLSNAYIGYKSTNPICVKGVEITNRNNSTTAAIITFKLQGSNSGGSDDWHDIASLSNPSQAQAAKSFITVDDNTDYYLYHRALVLTSDTSGGVTYVAVGELQFYGRELKVSVPKMATNTTPYGECISDGSWESDTTGDNKLFRLFDQDTETLCGKYPGNTTGQVGYKFTSPICVKQVRIFGHYSTGTDTLQLQGSDDGVTYEDIGNEFTYTQSQAYTTFDFANNKAYKYLILDIKGHTSYSIAFREIQFFGLDYSEKEFEQSTTKKWLYDHGVELETLVAHKNNDACTAVVGDEVIEVSMPASQQMVASVMASVNLTNYNLLRCRIANELIDSFKLAVNDSTQPTHSTSFVAMVEPGVGNDNIPNNVSVDISSFNNTYAVGVVVNQTSSAIRCLAKVKELWLE